ncbi:MAG: hypothetical protein RBT34_00230 [Anaerolineaceae bacterium]|jgi:hypothetical protein|nr:hypothetical protein [Anaerolineaceae bacterium]
MKALTCPVPPAPLLEDYLGYIGDAQYIAVYWERLGDVPIVTDGYNTTVSVPEAYWLFTNFLRLQYDVRTSWLSRSYDNPAGWWLIIDLKNRYLLMSQSKEAYQFLSNRKKPEGPTVNPTDENEIYKLIETHFTERKGRPAKDALAIWRAENQLIHQLWKWIEEQIQLEENKQ